MATKAESALEFINKAIAMGKTVYLSTPLVTTKVTPANFKKWAASGHDLFKINGKGDLLIARGKKFDCIVTKTTSLVTIQAA